MIVVSNKFKQTRDVFLFILFFSVCRWQDLYKLPVTKENARYHGKARPCMANALSSLVMAQKRSPLKRNTDTLNEILENGDNI